MQILRVLALAPPSEKRSAWLRDTLNEALALNLTPELFKVADAASFTVSVSGPLHQQLTKLSEQYDRPLADIAGGLVEALRAHHASGGKPVNTSDSKASGGSIEGMPGSERVRELLHDLLRDGDKGVMAGKIVFAEAATGTGKGNMIASLAATSALRGDSVVVSAPLPVTWQLLDSLAAIPELEGYGVTLLLGRPNFVSSERTLEWATEQEHQPLLDWLDKGAPALTQRTSQASKTLSHRIAYMLEDALSLAPNLPVDYCVLDAEDDPDTCEAEALYQEQRQQTGNTSIVICSHYMLAASCRMFQLRNFQTEGTDLGFTLPEYLDTLIVDEAHLLEGAFAAINSHSLRLRPLIKAVKADVSRGRKAAVDALETLYKLLQQNGQDREQAKSNDLDELPGLKPALEATLSSLEAIKLSSIANNATRVRIRIALRAARDALSGYSKVRVDLSPVKRHPMLVSGRANLKSAFETLWDGCAGAFLTSATLYTDGTNGNLARWKLEAPKERTLCLPSVHPAWTFEPVTYMAAKRVSRIPDDSAEWVSQTADAVYEVAIGAIGGTLVLCTSLQNTQDVAAALSERLAGRLVVQTGTQTASMCAMLFRSLAAAGVRPVWVGVGAAWTGIDLTDHAVAPEEDRLLTDLVVTRLPMGLNRSITHERRVRIAGFRVVSQEALWGFRQGLGRLVRRQGVKQRQLWVLDSRLDTPEPWVRTFNRLLAKYKKSGENQRT